MKQLKTILFATDFSEGAAAGAETARYLATLSGAHLHVVHVIAELAAMQRTMIPPSALETLEIEIERQAVVEIEAFCSKHFGPEIPTETHTLIGIPFKEILNKAQEVTADLIIIGTHGSTAERMLRRSTKIPVLAVPTP